MIEQILELLALYDYKGRSEAIDFAKGKYKIPKTFEDIKRQIKMRK